MSEFETSYATPHVQACNKWRADSMIWLWQNSIFNDMDKKILSKVNLSKDDYLKKTQHVTRTKVNAVLEGRKYVQAVFVW